MPLHLVKLCVGCASPEELETWQKMRRRSSSPTNGQNQGNLHITRQMPRRREELLKGGSLFWVMRGFICCRQKLVDLQVVEDWEGRPACAIRFEDDVIRTHLQPKRPFQGWRYLEVKDAPTDMGNTNGTLETPGPELANFLNTMFS